VREALLFRWLPHALQLVLVAAWIAGAIDLFAYVAQSGGGKAVAGLALFGPFLLFGSKIVDSLMPLGPHWRLWMFTALGTIAALPSIAALLYTRLAVGSWIHPAWL
jgi:hypothetical protein